MVSLGGVGGKVKLVVEVGGEEWTGGLLVGNEPHEEWVE